MEENLRRSLLISDGSWSFLYDRPLTLVIMSTILLIIGWQAYKSFSYSGTKKLASVTFLQYKNQYLKGFWPILILIQTRDIS